MTVRRLDPETGDIVTSGVQFISGLEEVAQTIKTRIRLYYGEYFRDINDGTPWFQTILKKDGTLSSKDAVLRRRIVQTPGVRMMLSFNSSYDIDTREYSVKAVVLTDHGQLNINELGQVV